MKNESAKLLWAAFLREHPEVDTTFDYWSFGNTPKMADELVQLVLDGKKTGTTSNFYLYNLENEPLPAEGEYSIILDGHQQAAAVIQTTKVTVLPFNEVTEEQAFQEGEGDQTLTYWRKVHMNFFNEEMDSVQKTFDSSMMVVYETFKLVYPKVNPNK